MTEEHIMTFVSKTELGWRFDCQCGRIVLIQSLDPFEKMVLIDGDKTAIHLVTINASMTMNTQVSQPTLSGGKNVA